MLRSVKALTGYVLQAEDGDIGRSKDFLLDDEQWTVRYLVADTGGWLTGRRVLISPISLDRPDWAGGRFPVRLTRKQIEAAPGLDEDAPASRRYEMQHHAYYGYPYSGERGRTQVSCIPARRKRARPRARKCRTMSTCGPRTR
jgi:hypothetical protein